MAEEAPAPGPVIQTPVADILTRIEGKVDAGMAGIHTRLDTKADKADLVSIWASLDHHAQEIATLKEENAARRIAETARHDHDADEINKRTRRRDAVTGLLMVVLTAGLVLAAMGVHL